MITFNNEFLNHSSACTTAVIFKRQDTFSFKDKIMMLYHVVLLLFKPPLIFSRETKYPS